MNSSGLYRPGVLKNTPRRMWTTTTFALLTPMTLVALIGCSANSESAVAPPQIANSPADSPTPSPSPTPTEVLLDLESAADRYLSIICPVNGVIASVDTAFQTGYPEWSNGGEPDPTSLLAAAAASRDTTRTAVGFLDDVKYKWPGEVRSSLDLIRSAYVVDLAYWDAIANSGSYTNAANVLPSERPEGSDGAGQEVRLQLQLSADTQGSCVGYEDGHQRLAEDDTTAD